MRPNLTVNLGLRIESQTNIHDHLDPAPRIGIAWAPGADPTRPGKTVLRAGFGIFYDRFRLENTVTALRYNCIVQQQYVIANPNFYPVVPSAGRWVRVHRCSRRRKWIRIFSRQSCAVGCDARAPAAEELDACHHLHERARVALIAVAGYQCAITGNLYGRGDGKVSVSGAGPIFLIDSSGLYNQNQVSFNLNSKLNAAVSLSSTNVVSKAMSNSDGLTFPANPWDFTGEYGPASTEVRHRVVLGGSINTKWNLRFNPLVTYLTKMPFNITTGGDPYGTTLYTARPGIGADPLKPGLIDTSFGWLDPNPYPARKHWGGTRGAALSTSWQISELPKTWGFGGEKTQSAKTQSAPAPAPSLFSNPASRRFNVTLAMSARNLLNHTNSGTIIGNITSPLFGRANQLAGAPNGEGFSENASNRRLEMQLKFTY